MIIPIRVLVCGGERSTDREAVFAALDGIARDYAARVLPSVGAIHLTIIHAARRTGVDPFADEWATLRKVSVCEFPSSWRSSFAQRNQQMIAEGEPDVVLAFPGDRNALDMVARARRNGVRVVFASWPRRHVPRARLARERD